MVVGMVIAAPPALLAALLLLASAAQGRSLVGARHGEGLAFDGEEPETTAELVSDLARAGNISSCTDGHCIVPVGKTWVLDTNLTVETLTIRGTLRWDTDVDNVELRAGYVLVEEGGHFQLGNASAPMQKKATINITAGGRNHYMLETRFLGSIGDAKIEIHGRPLQRTWTLLSRTAWAGTNQLFLKHDPLWMGWRPGDRIGLATTSRGESTTHRISRIGGATEWPLRFSGATAGVDKKDWNEAADNAIDGVQQTRWGSWCAPHCSGDDQWLQLRLENASHLTRIMVHFDNLRYAPKYDLECLHEGSWSVAARVENATGGWREVRLDSDCEELRLKADWASMDGRGALGSEPAWSGLWLYEVQAFGRVLGEEIPIVVHLEEPLENEHLGGTRTIEGRSFEIAAEVVNLERTVLITGEDSQFHATQQGIHTIMAGPGHMDIRYARVENCGQRDHMGRYCMHMHLVGNCTDCVLQGNAIVDSHQIGITLHGVHGATVEENTLWDVRAVGIYTEDGNEMHNTISHNVVICSNWALCNVQWLGKVGQSAGIYLVGMHNNVIANRVAGYLHGLWFAGSANSAGQGRALNRVCPMHTPLGIVRGNVNHDNSNFGLYLDHQLPRNLDLDEDGFVRNMGSCAEFTDDGRDNGVVPANVVEDGLDFHNIYVGQYKLGDISLVRMTSVNNVHSLYWKSSKNFADGVSHHVIDTVFANDWRDPVGLLQALGPSGPFTFLMTNTSFVGGPVGCGAVCAGQHCGRVGGGGPCNVQYLMQNVDFSRVGEGERRIRFGVNAMDMGFVQPIFTASDRSLGGYQSIVSRHLDGFASVPGCQALGPEWDNGYGCSVPVRRFNIWSPTDAGNLTISGPGYDTNASWARPILGMNAGHMTYEPMHSGYGTPVVVGGNYTLSGTWRGSLAMEFSDSRIAKHFGVPEAFNLTIGGTKLSTRCELFSTDNRNFLGPFGPQAGVVVPAMSKCTIPRQREEAVETSTTTTTTEAPGTCEPEEPVPCCPDGSCAETCTGGVQCCPGNITCPSASVVQVPTCANGKRFDCTNLTGVTPPGRSGGQCQFANEPGAHYYWDPWCRIGVLGCLADGINEECRFCGAEPWESVICPPPTSTTLTTMASTTASPTSTTTTASTTPMPTCEGLLGVERVCSANGCKVLTMAMVNRTCASFCGEAGLACLSAWEELGGGCELGEELPCTSARKDMSDLVCECEPAVITTTTMTTTSGLGFTIQMLDGLCLNVPQVNEGDVEVNLWPCDSSAGQRFQYSPATGQIRNLDGQCLDAPDISANGGLVHMWACDAGNWHQQWQYDAATHQIKNWRGICLDAPQRKREGGAVHMWACNHHNPNQQWRLLDLVNVPTTTVRMPELSVLRSQDGLCLLAPNVRDLGSDVHMSACNMSAEGEFWAYDEVTGLVRNRGGMCLDASQRQTDGGRVHTWACDTANLNQQWDYDPETLLLKNRDGHCLDAMQRKVEGGRVHMWSCIENNPNQHWVFMMIADLSMPATGDGAGTAVGSTAVAGPRIIAEDLMQQRRSAAVHPHRAAEALAERAVGDSPSPSRRRRRSLISSPVLEASS